MKTFFTIAGVLFIVLGMYALIHPTTKFPAKQEEVQVGPLTVPIETRRIVIVPPIAGGMMVLAGAAVVFLNLRNR